MPRSFANTGGLFAKETDKEAQGQIFHLITLAPLSITDEAGTTTTFPGMQLVDANYDITYNSIPYTKFPLKFSGVSVSTDGTIDKASITIANVSRTLMRELEAYDGLAGCQVSVITVYDKFLDFTYTFNESGVLTTVANGAKDATAHIRDEYRIDSYSANEQTISFQLNAVVDFDIRVPRRRYTPFSCYWAYKGIECGVGISPTLIQGTTSATGTVIKAYRNVASWLPHVGSAVSVNIGVGEGIQTFQVTIVSAAATPTVFGRNNSNRTNLTVTPALLGSTYVSISISMVPEFTTCNKSLSDCIERGNSQRYGGFAAVPTDTRRIFL